MDINLSDVQFLGRGPKDQDAEPAYDGAPADDVDDLLF